jgi:outer membrane protein assembly factor BamD (BamD/ComL family)
MRLMPVLCLTSLLGYAPLQCGSGDADSIEQRTETPGEALYGLAQEFKSKGDTDGWRRTLEYLRRRYPNSRFAVRAKNDLAVAENGVP